MTSEIIQIASEVAASSPEVTLTFVAFLAYIPQIVIILAMGLLIYSAHKNAGSKFDVFDYFIDSNTGKASITRSLQVLGGLTSTWIVVKLAVLGTLSTEMFAIYMAALGISEGWSKYIGSKFNKSTSDSTETKE